MDKKFDVVIVGTGAAGLYAALNFPESVNILLVSKRELQLSNSSLAQGGVACVLDTVHDSYKLHITDTPAGVSELQIKILFPLLKSLLPKVLRMFLK